MIKQEDVLTALGGDTSATEAVFAIAKSYTLISYMPGEGAIDEASVAQAAVLTMIQVAKELGYSIEKNPNTPEKIKLRKGAFYFIGIDCFDCEAGAPLIELEGVKTMIPEVDKEPIIFGDAHIAYPAGWDAERAQAWRSMHCRYTIQEGISVRGLKKKQDGA